MAEKCGTEIINGQPLALNKVMDDAFDFSQYTGAWLSLWLGFALEMANDNSDAHYFYRQANSVVSNIPGLPPAAAHHNSAIPSQVVRMCQHMQIGHSDSISVGSPKNIANDLTALRGSGSSAQTEEALRCLGRYLGLDSSRPDKGVRNWTRRSLDWRRRICPMY